MKLEGGLFGKKKGTIRKGDKRECQGLNMIKGDCKHEKYENVTMKPIILYT
jgi:hypothetical protein